MKTQVEKTRRYLDSLGMCGGIEPEYVLDLAEKLDECVTALRTITRHARETYPHFEDVRGQRDIKAAQSAIARATESNP